MGEGGGLLAELISFGYRPGDSVLHRLDPRVKLLCLIGVSLAVLNSETPGLGLWTLAFGLLTGTMGLPLSRLAREFRYMGLLILLVFLARSLSTPGEPVIRFWSADVTREGLTAGGLAAWRLALVVVLGLLLTATTRPWQVKAAVESLLKPFPFIPRRRVAFMMGLLLRFIPLILSAAKETSDAQRARAIENRRNPVYRMVKLIIPLMRRTFLEADRLATAMEARCYTDDRATPPLAAGAGDWLFLAAVSILAIAALALAGL